ncbi:MAG: S8 family serine peptidase [Bacteroidetes bacterium]|nr:S8 family serine peptidase [Bacteroidota bacterium]
MKNPLTILLLLVTIAGAQQLVIKTNGVAKNYPAADGIEAVAAGNAAVTLSADTDIRLIVELRSPSRIEEQLNGRSFSKTVADRSRRSLRSALPDAEVHQEFETIINAIALTVKRSDVERIAHLPEVRAVHPDLTVSAAPVDASSAPPVVPNSAAAATGAGVRIGVIDTGVDYLHEAFGGRMGSGAVIAGGYDLVNNDPDPMDDNGHGTHVTGIICGNSATLSGAAKDASVFVYKALDQSGNGTTSAVLAAIERAIADSVQILNMSLGTPGGSPDDPLSSAVNRAVRAGIVVVVAAGNTGEYTGISSPGVAPLALTVGAADGPAVASFSSKGPEVSTYGIKPDVVAQGVNILSAKRGGGYVAMSGTSMAAPFVTAWAAGLKQLHPGWSADRIRDAVITNARSLGRSPFMQGHGIADERILSGTVAASPAQLSFGFDPPGTPLWKQQRTVTIANTGPSARTYSFSVMSGAVPGITFRFTPQQFTIPANGTASVTVDLEANNLMLGNNNTFESGYTGTLLAAGGDSITIPYAFIKAPVMQLNFNEVPWTVLVVNTAGYARTIAPKTTGTSFILPDGQYDVVTSFYGSRFVIRENVAVNGRSVLDIASTQAVYPVSFVPVDSTGAVMALGTVKGTHSFIEALVHQPSGVAVVGMGGGKTTAYSNRPKYFSAMSKRFTYGYSMTLQPTNAVSYTYDLVLDSGVTAAKNFVFGKEDLKHVDVKYDLSASVQRAFPVIWTSFTGRHASYSVTFYDGNAEPLRFPFLQQTFHTRRTSTFPIHYQREAYNY